MDADSAARLAEYRTLFGKPVSLQCTLDSAQRRVEQLKKAASANVPNTGTLPQWHRERVQQAARDLAGPDRIRCSHPMCGCSDGKHGITEDGDYGC
jgi:folate-binding Fe-S cluster repair protein YgfZ